MTLLNHLKINKVELKEFTEKLDALKAGLEAKAKADATLVIEEKMAAIEAARAEADGKKDAELKKLAEDLDVTVKAFDLLQTRIKSAPLPGATPGQKDMATEFGEKLKERESELKAFRHSKKGFGEIRLEAKAVGNMTTSNTVGAYFVPATMAPGIQMKIYEQTHLRNVLPVGNTNSNVVRYVRDNGGEGGPGMVAMGALKPQMDRDLEILDAPVRKIATYFRVPEEMIEDIPYLQSFLVQIGMEEVMLVEDAQILYGDGTGQNLSGLFTNATAFAAGTSVVTAPNHFDVLLAAKKQGRVAKTNPTVALVHPTDFFNMIVKKDTSNNYLFLGGGNGIDVQGVLQVKGLPTIIEHTAVAEGDFLVFDPRNAAIFDRTGTSVRFYDQDQDNAIRNLITIVIEKRLALPIFRTDGIIKGTFSAAITDLTS